MGVLSFLVDELESEAEDTATDELWLHKVAALEERSRQLLLDIATHNRDHRPVRYSHIRRLQSPTQTKPRYLHVTIK